MDTSEKSPILLTDEVERLKELVSSLNAELLRVKTTQHGAAHALDNIGIELGLGANAAVTDIQHKVRVLRTEAGLLKNEVEAKRTHSMNPTAMTLHAVNVAEHAVDFFRDYVANLNANKDKNVVKTD